MVHHEDLTDHCATTLQRWRANIETHADRLTDLGHDERFQRLWRPYLSYSEAASPSDASPWDRRCSASRTGPAACPTTHIARPAAERATVPGDLDAAISGWRP
jgi:hypothetical protein